MRVLIDLTDIEKWSGNHGGIQRVVYGITKNLYLNHDDKDFKLDFISFSENENAFVHSLFTPIYERVETANHRAEGMSEFTTNGLGIKHSLRMAIREKVPEKIRTNKYARKTFKQSVKATKSVINIPKKSLKKKDNSLVEFVNFDKNDIVLVLGKPWDNLAIQKTLSLQKQKNKFKLVQVAYDLIISLYPHLHHPSLFIPYTQHMFEAVAASDLLLPISKSTELDLYKFSELLSLPKPKTEVIRLGDDAADLDLKIKKPNVKLNQKFLLTVGTVEIRKNHTLLYYTYKLALQRGVDLPQLVVVGSKGWLTEDIQYLVNNDPVVKDKIKILNEVDDSELAWLYDNCLFTIYPSFYEGWGLPIAESLARGKLCIASNTSSMTEIAGDLIEYFSPYNTEECLERILKYTDSAKLSDKESQIRREYRPYKWSETSAQVAKALKTISGS